ncbi:MAG TPA: hypothetical protein VF173_37355 [Thermoanaerobaculia bacterium]|nr:hypothetical protein [Thermoanaerobaculia bacterium]
MLAAMHRAQRLLLASVLFCLSMAPEALGAAEMACRPCAGLRLEAATAAANAADVARTLKESGHLEEGSPLFVAWEVPLDGGAAGAEAATAIHESGATPWLSLVFRTPAPLAQNAERLQTELKAAADLAGRASAGTWFQVIWRPEGGEAQAFSPAEYAFLLKRAAVALTGARQNVLVATEPLPADAGALQALYGQEVAAYLEAVVLQPAEGQALAAAVAAVQEADPGRPVVVDSLPLPAVPAEALAAAAREAAQGINLTLFQAPVLDNTSLIPALAPFALLAREFKGDLSYDPSSSPAGAAGAWSFVRGKDLSLRVIAQAPEGATSLALRFSDPQLRRPVRFPIGGERVPPPSGRIVGQELELQVDSPGRVAVLGLDRPTAAEMHGVAEKVTVSGEREMPVEEILRRLQAFEDAQERRLDHYSAIDTTSLRFQPTAGAQTFEATLQGPLFFSPKTGSDWAWETLYVNGVKWRSKQLPEIPLIQPEKAAALPLQIHFTKEYRYRLRGSDTLDGRDAWVVDFAPSGPGAAGKLYQGSVWVDKQTYARLRTRAVQIGLEGEVLSNEETMYYSPIDAAGNPAPWSAESFVLPLRLVSQQILSVVNSTTVVERDTRLTNVRINGPGFEEARKQVENTEVTMVRDTAKGLRYLVKDDKGERVVKEGYNRNKLFMVGGVFYDDALDYPLPLAGINYLSLDFKGTGKQLNVFFAGALLLGSFAEPRLFGTRFDTGANVFALAVPVTDTLFKDGKEDKTQDVKQRPATLGLKVGHPIGNFVKVEAEYDLLYFGYKNTSDTAKGFVVPSDNLTHSLDLSASFSRSGYGLSVDGSYNRRSKWDFWGLPGNPDWTPDKKDYLRWEARASKNWYLPKFQKAGLEFDYSGGSDLDRFSKYQFGFFGGTRVHGYQSNSVRAEEVYAGHASYGFGIGDVFHLEGIADAAWATDKESGLKNELLAGVGLQGTFVGPWQTVVNLDVGTPVAGPDHGFVLYLVFLKLFR